LKYQEDILGRKVHPYGFRLGVIKDWRARWFAEGQEYADLLMEDLAVRKLIRDEMGRAGIADIEIERYPRQVSITIHTAKPGIVIGRKGASVNLLKKRLEEMTKKKVRIDVQEVTRPDLVASLVAENVAQQLEKRISHKRAMKQAVGRAMRMGAKGMKIVCGGRLSGAEMARREWVSEGRVPRQTLRADIDYAQDEALTTYGRIGIKVWIYKGEVLPTAAEEALGS
jgi:small subunit ribosomal protein S3